jgi:hypothetical protein
MNQIEACKQVLKAVHELRRYKGTEAELPSTIYLERTAIDLVKASSGSDLEIIQMVKELDEVTA